VLTAGTPLDLGAVLVRPRQPEVRLEVPPGAPRESPTVLVTRGDRAEELETWRGDGVRDPWFAPGLVAEGAVVRVPALERFGETPSAVHVVPYVRRLEGAGPWTLRLPAGMVTVTPQRSDAAALGRWGVLLDGHRYAADGPTLTLAQVEDGPHELVVDVSGTTPKRVRFTLAKEPYSWAPRLRASPR
jgi:hypothetical protein